MRVLLTSRGPPSPLAFLFRHWTEAFAIPKSEDEVILRIMEIGFSKEDAQNALKVGNRQAYDTEGWAEIVTIT